jgi:drug/metabolite transporter (DMT)-like permease
VTTFWRRISVPVAEALRGTGDRAPNNLLGIVAMLAATAVFVSGDVIMKIMGQRMPTGETMFIRGIIGTILVWTVLWRLDMLGEVRRHLIRMIGWRTAAEVGASCSFQSGLTRLPFAEVGAIGQINPLVVTAAAAFFLGEKVGWRRWSATAVGLVGALLIIRPGGATFQWASLLILGAVFFSVSRDMITRKMEPGFSPFVLAAFSAMAIGLSSLMFLPFETWIWPAPLDVFWLAFPAILMMTGQVLVVISIRAGEVSAVVPFRYAAMLWSLTYSFLIWREVPEPMTFVGIAIVCGAGLYTFHREQVRRREAAMRNVSAEPRELSAQEKH